MPDGWFSSLHFLSLLKVLPLDAKAAGNLHKTSMKHTVFDAALL